MSEWTEQRRSRLAAGFTLVEVLLVIVIIGIIAGIALPNIGKSSDKARRGQVKAQIKVLEGAVDIFEMETGRYPNSLQDLVTKPGGVPNWDGPYLKKATIPKDPWGGEYVYTLSGDSYEIKSMGKGGASPISSQDL